MSDDYDEEMQSYRAQGERLAHNRELEREQMQERQLAERMKTEPHPEDCHCAWCEVERKNAALTATFDSADDYHDDGRDYMTKAEREEMREEKHRAINRVDGCHKKYWREEV